MKKRGPVRTEKHGSVSVPIYTTKTRTTETFVAVWYEGTQRFRRSFSSLEKASEFASKQAKALAKLGTATLALSGEELLAYRRAKEILAPFQLPIDTIAGEYAEARKALGATPLVIAAQDYVRIRPVPMTAAPPVSRVVDELLDAKRIANRSPRHLQDLSHRLRVFAKAFGCPVSEVQLPDVERWLAKLKVSGRTRDNFLAAVSNLIHFAERRGYLAKGVVDLASIERAGSEGEIQVFTPDELRRLLKNTRPQMIPWIAVAAFAGLRTAEASRLDWAQITDEHIEIKAKQAKTRQRRLVPIHPTLAAWLKPYRQESGPICPFSEIQQQTRRIAKDAKVPWKRNGLRHSYGTYRLAILKNEAQVALEMGNTPAMVFRHYRAVATEETARAWFAVGPGNLGSDTTTSTPET